MGCGPWAVGMGSGRWAMGSDITLYSYYALVILEEEKNVGTCERITGCELHTLCRHVLVELEERAKIVIVVVLPQFYHVL